MAKCPNCGAPMQENTCTYCHYTGNIPTNNSGSNQQPATKVVYANDVSSKSKWCAFLLCFFLGYFGVHKFYVGKIGMGVIYLFTFGLFGFGWFIDMILILCGTFKDSNGLFLKN